MLEVPALVDGVITEIIKNTGATVVADELIEKYRPSSESETDHR